MAPRIGASKRILAPTLGNRVPLLPYVYPLSFLGASNMLLEPSFIKGNLGANNRKRSSHGFWKTCSLSLKTLTGFEAVSGNKLHQV